MEGKGEKSHLIIHECIENVVSLFSNVCCCHFPFFENWLREICHSGPLSVSIHWIRCTRTRTRKFTATIYVRSTYFSPYSFHIHWKPSSARQCDSNWDNFARKTLFKRSHNAYAQPISACVQIVSVFHRTQHLNWQQMFSVLIEQCDNLCFQMKITGVRLPLTGQNIIQINSAKHMAGLRCGIWLFSSAHSKWLAMRGG